MYILEVQSKEEFKELIEKTVMSAVESLLLSKSDPERLLTRIQAAEFLNISLGTLHKHTKQGLIKGQRIGSRLMYRQSDLLNVLKPTNCKF